MFSITKYINSQSHENRGDMKKMPTELRRTKVASMFTVHASLRTVVLLFSILSAAGTTTNAQASISKVPYIQSDKSCQYSHFGGLIMERWKELGGPASQLGCPLTAEEEIGQADNRARLRRFEHGEGVWSPWTGGGSVLFAWHAKGGVELWWKTTEPFNYDKWQIRWHHSAGQMDRQTEFHGERTQGQRRLGQLTSYGDWTFTVQGCDDPGFLGHTRCNEGWMHPITVRGRSDACDGGQGIYLYEHINYQGRCSKVDSISSDARELSVGNDAVSSVRLVRCQPSRLFEHNGLFGESLLVVHDIPDLRSTPFGNDLASSIAAYHCM